MPDTQPKILITGGTGFAGSHLIEALVKDGYTDVYSTSFSTPDPQRLLLASDKYVQVDLSDSQATLAMMEKIKPTWIFHLASFAYVGKSFENARELFANNINLQLNILDAVKAIVPNARVLTIGSAEEYGIVDSNLELIDENCPFTPANPYAISKVTQDLLAQSYALSYKLPIIRARPFNHIGIRQTGDFAIPSFVQQIVAIEQGKQEKLQVGNLSGVRDFTSVKDMVAAYILLMEKGEVGQVYNIGSGVGRSMQWIIDTLISYATVPVAVAVDPSRMRPLDVPRLIADNGKIRALGWQPTVAIEEELKNILEEWRKK